jgi:hypothetical protein
VHRLFRRSPLLGRYWQVAGTSLLPMHSSIFYLVSALPPILLLIIIRGLPVRSKKDPIHSDILLLIQCPTPIQAHQPSNLSAPAQLHQHHLPDSELLSSQDHSLRPNPVSMQVIPPHSPTCRLIDDIVVKLWLMPGPG